MRNQITISIITIGLLSLLPSCQKVIDLQLNTTSSQIVIQGNIYDQSAVDTVKITSSVNFDQSNVYPAITGAVVTISSSAGDSDVLTEIKSGIYVTSTLQGVPGRTYTLTVSSGGQIYTASSTMPDAITIDSIYFENSSFGKEKQVTIDFHDPLNIKNYYRLVEVVNGVQSDQFYVVNDEIYDGEVISYSFSAGANSSSSDNTLKSGDRITIWLETVDKGVYEYFRTAGKDASESASPSNPVSNISNGALGYFNACSVRKISAVIK